MTIDAQPNEISYNGDGVTTSFAIPFPFDTAEDIKVLVTNTVTGAVQELLTGYSVVGTSVVFSVAPLSNTDVTILDDPLLTQPTDYISLDAFPEESHEKALDRVTRIAKRLHQQLLRTVKFPDGDVVSDGSLTSVVNRRGKYLYFNGTTGAIEYANTVTGQTLSQSIIGGFLYPQSAGEISAGIIPSNYAYPPGHVYRYGANTTPGTTDMTVPFRNAALSSLNPYAPSDTYLITASIPIRSNQSWRFDGAVINITGNTQVFTVADGTVDWKILGFLTLSGDNNTTGTTSGTGAAIVIVDSGRWYIENIKCVQISGWGILIQPGVSAVARAERGIIHCPQMYGCYVGMEVQAGTGAEYVQCVAPNISRCGTALIVAAGNLNVIGGNIVDNTNNGIVLQAGSNHCHGIFHGTQISHNAFGVGFGVRAIAVTNGQSFIGCHIYENNIWLTGSRGIIFESCVVDVNAYYFEGGQGNAFRDCTLASGYSNVINNNFNSVASHTIWENCKKLTGINQGDAFGNFSGIRVEATSAGITYTPANLTAEQTVLLTDSANYSANNNAQSVYDGYSAGTGKFTCWGLGDGHVRVSAQFAVSNNAADNMANVYMYIRKNGAGALRYLNRIILATTSTYFSFDGTLELSATDTIEFRIGQTSGIVNNVTIAATGTDVFVEGL